MGLAAAKIVFVVIIIILILVVVVYFIGLIRRAMDAIKRGNDPSVKQILSPLDNLYEGSIGLFKKK